MLLERPFARITQDAPPPRLALLTRGLQRVETLAALLPDWTLTTGASTRSAAAVLAWGRKPSARIAEQFAERHGLPLLRAEDGFLRSTDLGHRCPPLSIVLDDQGIYYDAGQPSQLESLIATPLGTAQLERGARLRAAWTEARVSKYNHARDGLPDALLRQAATDPPVLVIDQTAGDASIAGAGASLTHFRWMLQAALDEHPGAPGLAQGASGRDRRPQAGPLRRAVPRRSPAGDADRGRDPPARAARRVPCGLRGQLADGLRGAAAGPDRALFRHAVLRGLGPDR